LLSQHAINSGIIKLSSLTPLINVFRGMSGLALPKQLEGTDKFGSSLAIEYGEFLALAVLLSLPKWVSNNGTVLRFGCRIHVHCKVPPPACLL
jgi:hypothetical protein